VLERLRGKQMRNNNTNYQVGDFLITLKNASMAKNKTLKVANSKKILAIAEALKKMGFLSEVKKEKDGIAISLAYKSKTPVLQNVRLVSKPGLRVYWGVDELDAKRGPSTMLISTPKGLTSLREAVKMRTGGEVLAEIW
jgi:small subunit ribosomal protein S8